MLHPEKRFEPPPPPPFPSLPPALQFLQACNMLIPPKPDEAGLLHLQKLHLLQGAVRTPPGLLPYGLCSLMRKHRGEKRPIPEDLKDEKYYERRRRNNEAAKKSRDARKMREDQIALRATLLEQENALLRAQLQTLREELFALRQEINYASLKSAGLKMQSFI